MSRTVQRITLNLTSRPAVALENLQARNDESLRYVREEDVT